MAQKLKMLVLAEGLAGFPASTRPLITIRSSSSPRGPALFWPPWLPGKLVMHRHKCKQNTYTHKGKIKKSKKIK